MANWIELLHQNIKIEGGRGWIVIPQGRKTKVWRRLAKDTELIILEADAIWTYLFKQENAPLIRNTVKRLTDLTRNSGNPLSRKEAQAKVETKSTMQSGGLNWQN